MKDIEIPTTPIGNRIETLGLCLSIVGVFGIVFSLWPYLTEDTENQFKFALILTSSSFLLGILFQGLGRILTINEIKLKLLLEGDVK